MRKVHRLENAVVGDFDIDEETKRIRRERKVRK
jgi:hypothetical protein